MNEQTQTNRGHGFHFLDIRGDCGGAVVDFMSSNRRWLEISTTVVAAALTTFVGLWAVNEALSPLSYGCSITHSNTPFIALLGVLGLVGVWWFGGYKEGKK